jgi:flagellum-specific ATP synthase
MKPDVSCKWQNFLSDASRSVSSGCSLEVRGTLTRLTGLVLEAAGIRMPVGSQCLVSMKSQPAVLAEVVGFSNDRAFLMPAGDVHGLSSGASVVPAPAYVAVPRLGEARAVDAGSGFGVLRLPMGDGLLGRVVDAQGAPMDRMGPIVDVTSLPLDRKQINAMDRAPVRNSLDTGVRAINALVDSRQRPAHWFVFWLGGWQKRFAGNDGPLYPGRCDCCWLDWRAGA